MLMSPLQIYHNRLYSLMYPGAGQIYADNKVKGIAFSLLGSGMVSVLLNKTTQYNTENETLGTYQAAYQNATTASELETTGQKYQNQVNQVNDLQSQLLLYGGGLAATWVINVVDAILFHGLKSD